MLFNVVRTSEPSFDENKMPCKNATIGEENIETNLHMRDERGRPITLCKIKTIKKWQIEINSLEELTDLLKEVDDGNTDGLLIYQDDSENPTIEIYDSYRD